MNELVFMDVDVMTQLKLYYPDAYENALEKRKEWINNQRNRDLKEKNAVVRKIYAHKNKEKVKEWKKNYYYNNPEKRKEYARDYYRKNHHHIYLQQLKYRGIKSVRLKSLDIKFYVSSQEWELLLAKANRTRARILYHKNKLEDLKNG